MDQRARGRIWQGHAAPPSFVWSVLREDDIFEIVHLLGKEESIARISYAIETLGYPQVRTRPRR